MAVSNPPVEPQKSNSNAGASSVMIQIPPKLGSNGAAYGPLAPLCSTHGAAAVQIGVHWQVTGSQRANEQPTSGCVGSHCSPGSTPFIPQSERQHIRDTE